MGLLSSSKRRAGSDQRPQAISAIRRSIKRENNMATVDELQAQIKALEVRLVALERSLFGERHGALETRTARTVPVQSNTK